MRPQGGGGGPLVAPVAVTVLAPVAVAVAARALTLAVAGSAVLVTAAVVVTFAAPGRRAIPGTCRGAVRRSPAGLLGLAGSSAQAEALAPPRVLQARRACQGPEGVAKLADHTSRWQPACTIAAWFRGCEGRVSFAYP
jgi:hypothetical protein